MLARALLGWERGGEGGEGWGPWTGKLEHAYTSGNGIIYSMGHDLVMPLHCQSPADTDDSVFDHSPTSLDQCPQGHH